MKRTIVILTSLMLVVSCTKPDPTLKTVITKQYFTDAKGEHWVLDCKTGTKKVNGKTENVYRHDEVDQKHYNATRTYNFTTGQAGDKC